MSPSQTDLGAELAFLQSQTTAGAKKITGLFILKMKEKNIVFLGHEQMKQVKFLTFRKYHTCKLIYSFLKVRLHTLEE